MFLINPDSDLRRQCRLLYWCQWDVTTLSRELGIPRTTIESWKSRDKWDDAPLVKRIGAATEARYMLLISKDKKTPHDFKEIDLLARQLERYARIERYKEPGGNEGHLNPNVENRNSGPKKRKPANFFTDAQIAKLQENFEARMFGYQRRWKEARLAARIRNILKSRQIGATYYFAFEALVDAITTGKNKLFVSASKAQAFAFRSYMIKFAREVDVDLKGDPIIIGNNNAEMHFLSTNFRSTQSFSGDLYFDEYQWTANFLKVQHTAAGMASQKRYGQTYITTPSSTSHEGWTLWSGAKYNKGRGAKDRVEFDLTHSTLRHGLIGPDRQWRNIVTLEDALAEGCDLFDIAELRAECSPEEFDNKYGCRPIDDHESVFPFSELEACMVDAWEDWLDVKPFASRPYGSRPVWIGYDPAKSGDGAAIVVIAAPLSPLSPFRMLEREMFKGMDYEAQVDYIRKLTQRYNVEHIGMDTNSVGAVVIEAVRHFFPTVVGHTYNPQVKTMLVFKTKEVVKAARLQFDRGWQDVAHAFMAIRKGMTPSGKHVTYFSQRSESIGHADAAWATMHALIREPLTAVGDSGQATVEIF